MSSLKIAVLGAGPAGLTLARLLQQNGIQCTVYESEPDHNARNQGGSLDLHPQSGQLALKHAGLFEEFQKLARPEGEAMKVLKFDGRVLWDENESGSARAEEFSDHPEIDRVLLREMLLDSVRPDSIRWGFKVERVEVGDGSEGMARLCFADGSEETGYDLVVGSDGAWSKVRPLLTDAKPFYSGVTAIELWTKDVNKRSPWLSDFVGKGSCFMFDEGRALLCQRNGNDAIRIYACVRKPEDWLETCGIDFSDPDKARRHTADQYFGDCGEDIKRAIMESRDEVVPRKLWMLPVGHTWEGRPGVTCIGDAAHLMTPFGGVGVNLAMTDALVLAQALVAERDEAVGGVVSGKQVVASAVSKYESEMFERSERFAKNTAHGLEGHFSADGAEEFANKLAGRRG